MFIIYTIGFFFIVRYHAFTILFLAVCLPMISAFLIRSFKNLPVQKFLLWLAVTAVIFLEAFMSFRQVRQYEEFFWGETASLIRWFREEGVSGKTFLADIKLSPMLLAYCDASIILQPKFELGGTRKKVEDYIKIIYHGTERDLMRFCDANSVEYYVYDRGLAGPMNIYSFRYFANAKNLNLRSPVHLMSSEQGRRKLRYFYEIFPPEKMSFISNRYIVFKVISDNDSVRAQKWAKEGEGFLKNGNFDMARRLAKSAVYADPYCYQARLLYAKVFNSAPVIKLRGY